MLLGCNIVPPCPGLAIQQQHLVAIHSCVSLDELFSSSSPCTEGLLIVCLARSFEILLSVCLTASSSSSSTIIIRSKRTGRVSSGVENEWNFITVWWKIKTILIKSSVLLQWLQYGNVVIQEGMGRIQSVGLVSLYEHLFLCSFLSAASLRSRERD